MSLFKEVRSRCQAHNRVLTVAPEGTSPDKHPHCSTTIASSTKRVADLESKLPKLFFGV